VAVGGGTGAVGEAGGATGVRLAGTATAGGALRAGALGAGGTLGTATVGAFGAGAVAGVTAGVVDGGSATAAGSMGLKSTALAFAVTRLRRSRMAALLPPLGCTRFVSRIRYERVDGSIHTDVPV
jgi:hypothetical protein